MSEENAMIRLQLGEAKLSSTDTPPAEVEERIKKYEMATVLFAYISGFNHLTDAVDSEVIMDQLDEVLIEFDRILRKYRIHNIKTIGETYMAAGGIPLKNITNPIDVIMAAIEMNLYLNQVRRIDGRRYWNSASEYRQDL